MDRNTGWFVVVVAMLWLSGCATIDSINTAERGTPKVFSGMRLNAAAIAEDASGLRRFKAAPPRYPWVDLPFSLAADLVLFPLASGAAAYEALFD
jgi:uncharacterized protein YceK